MIDSIDKTFKDALVLLKKKSHDYAGTDDPFKNFRSSTVVGVEVERAILVRIMDKVNRISNLLDKDAQVASESVQDTIIDAICYFAILKAYLEQK